MKQTVTEKQIEKSLKPSKVRTFFNNNLTKRFRRGECNSCALARYLQSELRVGRDKTLVYGYGEVKVNGVYSYLPDWAMNFVKRFDNESPLKR